ncbi:unnamed protein product [Effrenium voratum]|nr:unnamed protein product [Effrenium voratum]
MQADVQPNVMKRLYLFSGKGITVRLHFFQAAWRTRQQRTQFTEWQNCSETYIHNHRSSYISVGLAGAYENQIFTTSAYGQHFTFNRTQDLNLRSGEPRDGGLRMASAIFHTSPAAYFLHGESFHRVIGKGPALTLFVRGQDKPYNTMALAEEAKPDWKGVNQEEEPLATSELPKLGQEVTRFL